MEGGREGTHDREKRGKEGGRGHKAVFRQVSEEKFNCLHFGFVVLVLFDLIMSFRKAVLCFSALVPGT